MVLKKFGGGFERVAMGFWREGFEGGFREGCQRGFEGSDAGVLKEVLKEALKRGCEERLWREAFEGVWMERLKERLKMILQKTSCKKGFDRDLMRVVKVVSIILNRSFARGFEGKFLNSFEVRFGQSVWKRFQGFDKVLEAFIRISTDSEEGLKVFWRRFWSYFWRMFWGFESVLKEVIEELSGERSEKGTTNARRTIEVLRAEIQCFWFLL